MEVTSDVHIQQSTIWLFLFIFPQYTLMEIYTYMMIVLTESLSVRSVPAGFNGSLTLSDIR